MPLGTWNDPYTIGGILDDPEQLNQLYANPLFNMGMGLMASGYDSNVNPYSAMIGGMSQSRMAQREDDVTDRAQAQRDALMQYFMQMQQGQQPPLPGASQQSVAIPGHTPFAGGSMPSGEPDESALREYVKEQAWKYQLGIE